MSVQGVHVGLRTLALASASADIGTEPIGVTIGSGAGAAGKRALGRARSQPEDISLAHWRDLAMPERAQNAARLCARELRLRIDGVALDPAAPIAVAIPPDYDLAAVPALGAVAAAAGLPRIACVDGMTAVAAAARFAQGAVVLDVGWQQVAAAAIDGGARFARRNVTLDSTRSLDYLYRRWMDVVAAAMVKQTRFDPLHDRANEQALFDALPELLARATQEDSVRVELPGEAAAFAIDVPSQWFEDAAAGFYRQVLRLTNGVQRASAQFPLLLPEIMRGWPGFVARLLASTEQPVRWVPEGFGARAAARLASLVEPGVATWRLPEVEDSALQQELVAAAEWRQRAARALPITHALFAGESLRLLDAPLVIGREPASGGPEIRIASEVAGVSRRHCSIVRDDGGTVVIDHSRHGTWVNGARVSGRATLQPGDRLRVGVPGVEITLISAAAAHGTASA
jgi:hypothetical protein